MTLWNKPNVDDKFIIRNLVCNKCNVVIFMKVVNSYHASSFIYMDYEGMSFPDKHLIQCELYDIKGVDDI